jgi:hypothetical protein
VFGRKQQKIMKLFNNTGIINMRSYKENEWITNKTAEIIKTNFTSQKSVHMSLECNENSMERNQLNNKEKKVTINCSNKR